MSTTGCSDDKHIVVVHADSLARPLADAKAEFERRNPGVRVDLSAFGSLIACRQLESGVPCDVLILADRHLFPELLYPKGLADWNATFATGEIVILKSGRSRYAAEITADNWFEILVRPDVKVGIADARLDPCGYWTRICWILAERKYGKSFSGKGLAATLSEKCGADYQRPDSQQLIAMVEGAGGWDYAFVYRSQAEQLKLSYVRLAPEIRLSATSGTAGPTPADVAKLYAEVEYRVDLGGGRSLTRRGEPVPFALTIPKSARRKDLAADFVRFLLGEDGRRILGQGGLDTIHPPIWDGPDRAPPGLSAQSPQEKSK